jgi:hypothetical protein
MTKATIIGITTLVWSAGFAATGAFVYTVTQPTPTPPTIASPTVATPAPPPRVAHDWRERTIVLPTVEIVGELPHRAPPTVTPPATPAVKPHEPHCSEWRPLEQGSNAVQICD